VDVSLTPPPGNAVQTVMRMTQLKNAAESAVLQSVMRMTLMKNASGNAVL